MNINECFPSRWLSAADLQGRQVAVVIREVTVENLSGDASDPDEKPVVYFEGKKKGLGLNKTNSHTIAAQFGPETNNWAGQTIVLFPTQTDYRGKTVACIRVKINSVPPQPAPPPPAVVDAAVDADDGPHGEEIPF